MSPNLQETLDLVLFTEEILYGKLHFFYSVSNEYCQIFKNTYFEEHLRATASGSSHQYSGKFHKDYTEHEK